jgi:WD40 repeat protein/cell division protein FtsB
MKPAGQSLAPPAPLGFEPGTAEPAGEEFNPFPGLRSFEPDEYFLFFGRDRQTEELVRRLRRHRFIAVLGTSGSGKSSLVRAGLIPALESGAMAATDTGWRVAIFRPGENPFQNLGEALARVLVDPASPTPDLERSFLNATLRASGLGLVECVRQARLQEGEKLLIVADQFEEVFRFKEQGDRQAAREHSLAFVRVLLEAAREERGPIYIVLTMRSDYIGQCMEFPNLPEAINQGLYLVPRMTRDELRSAITGPVAVGGAEISPSLVVRLLNDIGDNQDQLPILQHALMRTWESWSRNPADEEKITLDDYKNAGTMSGALDKHAEEAYSLVEKLPRGREIAEKLFRSLTEKDAEGKDVRRLVSPSEVIALTGATAKEVEDVVEAFRQRSFLVLREDGALDLSHESLIRIWQRLADWVKAEAQSARTYRELARRAAEHKEGKAGLLRDPELEINLRWREDEKPSLVWAQRYDPSFEQAMRYLRRSELRKLLINTGLTLLVGIFAVLASYTAWQGNEFKKINKRLVRSEGKLQESNEKLKETNRDLEKQKEDLRKTNVQLNKAFDNLRISEGREKRSAFEAEEARSREEQERKKAEEQAQEARAEREEAVRQTGISRQAVQGLEQANKSEADARKRADAQRLRSLAREIAAQALLRPEDQEDQEDKDRDLWALLAVQAFRFNRTAGGDPEDPEINMALRRALGWLKVRKDREAVVDGHADVIADGHADAVRSLILGPGDRWVSGGEDGQIRWHRWLRPKSSAEIQPSLPGAVRSVAFDGRDLLAAGRSDGSLQVWRAGSNASFSPVNLSPAPHGSMITALAFGPSGLVVGRARGELELWEPPGGQANAWTPRIVQIPQRLTSITSIAILPGGREMIVGTQEGALRLASSPSPGQPRKVCDGRVHSVAVNQKGWLACGADYGRIRVVDEAGRPFDLTGHTSTVNSLSFSRDGDFLASASSDKTVDVWDLRRLGATAGALRPIVLKGHESWVWTVAFAPDDRLLSGSQDKTIRVWTVRAEALAREICRRLKDRDLAPGDLKHLGDIPSVKTCTASW